MRTKIWWWTLRARKRLRGFRYHKSMGFITPRTLWYQTDGKEGKK